jgi:hypothetical protein
LNKNSINIFLLAIILIFVISNIIHSQNLETNNLKNLEKIQDEIVPLCDGVSFSDLNNLNYRNIELIDILIPNSADWYRNFYKAHLYSTEKGNYINNIFKKEFPANLNITYDNGILCSYKAEVRINGDLSDHIDINNLVVSLDVNLQEGNIFGITRFKLLIPETRRDDEEIFATTLLKELGFLSPRTFYVLSSINSNNSHKFIFQEKLVKEMLEYNGYREGPILETNEEYVWNSNKDSFYRRDDLFDKQAIEIGRVINTRWANLSKSNKTISLQALEAFNKSLTQTIDNKQLNNEMLGLNKEIIYMFEAASRALVANHQVTTNHNRQFFFNKLTNSFIPSYYDGNPEFFINPPRHDGGYINIKQLNIGAKKVIDLPINSNRLLENLKLNGLNMSLQTLESYLENFKTNLEIISNYELKSDLKHPTYIEQIELRRETDLSLLFYDTSKEEAYLCNRYLDECNKGLNLNNLNIFNKNLTIDGSTAHLFGTNKSAFLKEDATFSEGAFYEELIIDQIKVFNFNNVEIDIDKKQRKMVFYITNKRQKVLITSKKIIDGWTFVVKNTTIGESLESRSDENLLTGCLTFYASELKNVSIQSDYSHCEDSVNLINTEGTISSINISNSFADGLDIDSSQITIDNIDIVNSGNDCLDVSQGIYYFEKLSLSSCKDKAISIGESSRVSIKQSIIDNSKIGLAVKDSSDVDIKNFEGREINYCVQIYRKKQEFGPSKLEILNNTCLGIYTNYIQKGSVFNES